MATTISDINADKRIILGAGGYIGRPFAGLADHTWTKIRIALRFCLSDTGGNITPTQLRVGLACGASFPGMAGGNPVHAYNFRLTGETTETMTRHSAGQLPPGFFDPNSYQADASVGELWIAGTETLSLPVAGNNAEDGITYIGAQDDHRTMLFCEITKASPKWKMQSWRMGSAACPDVYQIDYDDLLGMPLPDLSVGTTGYGYNSGDSVVAPNEAANGYFSYIFVSWNLAAPTVKISAFGASRLY